MNECRMSLCKSMVSLFLWLSLALPGVLLAQGLAAGLEEGLFGSSSAASGADPRSPAEMSGNPAVERSQHQDWESVCVTVANGEDTSERLCQIRQALDLETEQGTGRVLEVVLRVYDAQRHVMEIVLPVGLDLRAGIVLQVDDGQEVNAPFLTCLQQGCLVAMLVEAEMLAAMRRGRVMRVGFRPFNAEQVLVLEVSLRGFTAASRMLRP